MNCSNSPNHWPCGPQPDADCLSLLYVCDGERDCQVTIILYIGHTWRFIACQLIFSVNIECLYREILAQLITNVFAQLYYSSFLSVRHMMFAFTDLGIIFWEFETNKE